MRSDMSKYKTGNFISKKNNSSFVYRSAYEYAYLTKLEKDDDVINFIVEPFKIPYTDDHGKPRSYIPDIVVLRKNGLIEILEIKPKSRLCTGAVQRKASAARSYIKRNFKNSEVVYRFITEEDIFATEKEYLQVLKTI